jgi:hypothetical protein
MTSRKLRTFEEKANAFLKSFESGYKTKDYFLKRYPYLNVEEVETFITLYQEIEKVAYQLTRQVTSEDGMIIETIRATIKAALERKITTSPLYRIST